MATRKTTTGRADGTRQRPPGQRFETSPERLAAIRGTLDAVCDVGGALDAFDSEKDLRALAQRLRLPYLAVQLTQLGITGLTERDVDEYNAWRAACAGKRDAR
jgi:hypothetical protein